MNFGSKMQAMRAIRDMSQTTVAWYSGVSYRFINQAEGGKREMNADQQFKIRVTLDWPVELDVLLEQVEQGGYPK